MRYAIVYFLFLAISLSSCTRNFLDKKPSTDLIVPTSLNDLQMMLENDQVLNETPNMGELGSDNYYLANFQSWQALYLTKERNCYIWAKDIYEGTGTIDDWNEPYQQVFYANVALDGIAKIATDSSNQQDWNFVKGRALFMRAYAFYNLAQLFAPPYDSSTAGNDLGIPLRLSANVNAPSKRATVQQTYDQIQSDLVQALRLLPSVVPYANRNRPSRPAAMALLARLYLSMRDYYKAGAYADSCLHLHNALIDYNAIASPPIFSTSLTMLNDESIYQSRLLSNTNVLVVLAALNTVIDSTLYQSYSMNDLRRSVFFWKGFTGNVNMKTGYSGSLYPFSGLATDEVYLTRAECYARSGNVTSAMNDLNTVLQKRWTAGTFMPYTAIDPSDALRQILAERRKELIFRGLRWSDLRRLNKEGANITLTRTLNGQSYTLPPNSPLYVLPIPPDVINSSGITQNAR